MGENVPFDEPAANKEATQPAHLQSDQSLFSAGRNIVSSAIQNEPSEDSDQPAQMCRLI